jgi:uncharacterized membrane protein
MVGWGFGDFLAKRVVGSLGHYRLMLYTQLVALAPSFGLAAAYPLSIPSSTNTITLIVASGICGFSGLFFFYKGLSMGKASIVTPVVSTSAIVAMALSFAVLGESLSLWQVLCLATALAGVMIVTMTSKSTGGSNSGIPYALVAMLSAGLGSVLIKLVSEDLGAIATYLFSRFTVVLMLLMIAPFAGTLLLGESRGRKPIKSILIIGLAEFLGFFAFVVGLSVGVVAIVAPLSSTSPVLTVVLAQIFLREELVRIQKTGVVLVIAGIILLSILST